MFDKYALGLGSFKPKYKSKVLEGEIPYYTSGDWSPHGPSKSINYAKILQDMKDLDGVSSADARDAFRVFVALRNS